MEKQDEVEPWLREGPHKKIFGIFKVEAVPYNPRFAPGPTAWMACVYVLDTEPYWRTLWHDEWEQRSSTPEEALDKAFHKLTEILNDVQNAVRKHNEGK